MATVSVGIDVCSAALDVSLWPNGEQWRTTNDAPGVAELVERLRSLDPVSGHYGGQRRSGIAGGGDFGGGRVTRGGGESPPGAGLCKSQWPAGQNG